MGTVPSRLKRSKVYILEVRMEAKKKRILDFASNRKTISFDYCCVVGLRNKAISYGQFKKLFFKKYYFAILKYSGSEQQGQWFWPRKTAAHIPPVQPAAVSSSPPHWSSALPVQFLLRCRLLQQDCWEQTISENKQKNKAIFVALFHILKASTVSILTPFNKCGKNINVLGT